MSQAQLLCISNSDLWEGVFGCYFYEMFFIKQHFQLKFIHSYFHVNKNVRSDFYSNKKVELKLFYIEKISRDLANIELSGRKVLMDCNLNTGN